MFRRTNLRIGLLLILGIVATSCTGTTSSTPDEDALNVDALPQGETAPAAPPPAAPAAPPPAAPATSTCAVAREAFLTGTPAQIETALRALIADRSADATAREYAQYYLERDKGNPELQEMDKSLIQMSCQT